MRLEGWPQAKAVQAAILRDAAQSAGLIRMRVGDGFTSSQDEVQGEHADVIQTSETQWEPAGRQTGSVVIGLVERRRWGLRTVSCETAVAIHPR